MMNKINKPNILEINYSRYILFGIFVLFFVFFVGAFSTHFFSDDYKFLAASKAFNFLLFLSPIRTTFYRPLPTEFFYFILQRLPFPILTGHIFVFIIFLLGVFILYKTLLLFTKNRILSLFSSILYLFHFSHVYQLYWFATFQEVAQFTLLISSLYFTLRKRFAISIVLFVLALFSKEQAILFPFVALFFYYLIYKKIPTIFFLYFFLDSIFVCLHLFVNFQMPILQEYIIHISPKLIINNALWYGLWSLGFPAMMPDYMRSIFSLPFGAFWTYFSSPGFSFYFFGMLLYTFIIVIFLSFTFVNIKVKKNFVIYFFVGSVLFILFLLPVLPIIHRWMVRLTIPLVFISTIQGLVLASLWKYKKMKLFIVLLVALYLVWNYFGIKQHEVISTYKLESSITKQAINVFSNENRFEKCKILFIKDPKRMNMSSWDGSEKLALSLSGDSFLSYYFPKRDDLKVEYEYVIKKPSIGSCIINADELIQYNAK